VTQLAARWNTAMWVTYITLPQGPSLRSGFYCPGPSTLTWPHPPHLPAQRDFAALRFIRAAFAVRERLGDRRVVPCFHCAFRLDMPPSTTPGSSPAAHAQLLDRRRWPSHDPNCSALPTSPQSAPRGPVISGLHRFTLAAACRLACLPGGSDRDTLPADGDVYTRASDESVTLPVAEYDYDGSWAASIGGTSTRRNSS
jgi:hypothetical protein